MAPELRILAEVNVLCTSEHSVEWVPLINHLIPITLTHKQDLTSGATVIHLGADSDDHDVTLDLHISLSESKLKKASECFVRWKDLQSGKIWGLNFLSEEEAFEFMAFCEGLSPSASSSASSNQSLTRRSTSSSQNSSQSRESSSKNSARDDASQACPLTTILTEDNNNGINGGKNVALDNGFGSTCEQFNGNVDRTDNQEDHELSVTEISYFKEMEIFHTTRNPNDVKNVDHFDGDGHVMSHVDHENGDISDSAGLRRTGWLSMKQVLACGRGGRLEQLSHKKWKNFWVVLKGYQLNLYQCDDKDVGAIDLYQTDTTVELERCLAQAVPEHAKLENVFGISTQNGEAYYFQGSCQSEIEGWIVSIHCAAAVQFAGGRGKEQTKWLLNKELEKVRENVDSDGKLKKMAELQLTVVTEPKNKQVITDQIAKWDQTVEKWSLDAYKFQCYLAAVAGVRTPPNPQHVLACASKPTRHVMSRFGAFSVVTFHSIVYSRARRSSKGDAGGTLKLGAGKTVKRSKSSVGYSRLKSALMSSLKISDSATAAEIRDHHSPKGCRRVLSVDGGQPTVEDAAKYSGGTSTTDWSRLGGFVRVELPDSAGSTVVVAKNDMTFVDVVNGVTKKRQLDPDTYFIMFGVKNGSQIEYYTPQEEAFIDDQNFNVLKLCKKSEYNIEMSRSIGDTDASYGLSFKIDNCRVIVSHVEEGSKSHLSGFYEGDEILAVNNNDIFDPENGLGQVLCAIAEPFVSLRIRSLREEVPEQIRKATESIISTLVCPPPPKTSSSDVLDVTELIVPPPQLGDFINDGQESPRLFGAGTTNEDGASVNVLLQSAEEVTSFCRQRDSFREVENQTELSDAEKLRKIILELIDTEKNYLKDVQTLMKRYLEPLKHETFLPTEEVNSLAETVSQILQFQSDFCNEIQQLIDCENNFKNINEIGLFQNLIYGIGEAFLQYADKFKLYSSFCATHSRIIHMIHPDSNVALEEFLNARNPKQQHSTKLESYLIKPIQRVLKYPLLLNGMLKLLNEDSDEHHVLSEAVSAIENVAEHINEMQSITEQFLQIFQELAKSNGSLEVTDVDIDKLLLHKKLVWLNSPETMKASSLRWSPAPLRKMKSESVMRCFVFPKAVILIQVEKRQKKKDKTSKGSPRVSEEINFKTLIPVTSLILRDHSWSDQELFNAWELVDISSSNIDSSKPETIYLLSTRNCDDRNEMVKKIKETIRNSMLRDKRALSRQQRPISLLSTTSIHLGFPEDNVRRSLGHELTRPRSKHLGRHHSTDEAFFTSSSLI